MHFLLLEQLLFAHLKLFYQLLFQGILKRTALGRSEHFIRAGLFGDAFIAHFHLFFTNNIIPARILEDKCDKLFNYI